MTVAGTGTGDCSDPWQCGERAVAPLPDVDRRDVVAFVFEDQHQPEMPTSTP